MKKYPSRKVYHKPTYESWVSVKSKCFNQNKKEYRYWVGEITDFQRQVICDAWLRYDAFLADMGERPEGTRLVRLDPYLGYFPGNCAWRTREYHRGEKRGIRVNKPEKKEIGWGSVWGAMR